VWDWIVVEIIGNEVRDSSLSQGWHLTRVSPIEELLGRS
jgi:hypothetical protein